MASAKIAGGVITGVNVISSGSGYSYTPIVTFATMLPSFDEQIIAILADYGHAPLWLKAIDTFRAMGKFGDSTWIEVAGHCHGLLYRADGAGVREELVWDKPPPEDGWIIWRAHQNRFYKGERGALLAGAGILLDGESL